MRAKKGSGRRPPSRAPRKGALYPRRLNLCARRSNISARANVAHVAGPNGRVILPGDFRVVRCAFDDGFGKRGGRQTAENVE